MLSIEVQKAIDLPADKAWALIDDFGAISNFHPLVHESGLLSSQTTGKGAERFCDFGKGNRVAERITDYTPGESMTIAITEAGTFPLKSGNATMSVRARGADRSEVTFRLDYEPKFGRVGRVMGRTVMASQFRKIFGRVIDGLENYGRTGTVQSLKTLKRAS